MKIEQAIKNAMAQMIQRKLGIENVIVGSWIEDFEKGWSDGCSTCGYGADDDIYSVDIWYTQLGSPAQMYFRHEGSFGDLIKELDA